MPAAGTALIERTGRARAEQTVANISENACDITTWQKRLPAIHNVVHWRGRECRSPDILNAPVTSEPRYRQFLFSPAIGAAVSSGGFRIFGAGLLPRGRFA